MRVVAAVEAEVWWDLLWLWPRQQPWLLVAVATGSWSVRSQNHCRNRSIPRDTKPSCADHSRKRVSASTATSANSRTACRNYATFSVIQSTRPSCAARSTAWASARTDPGATLSTTPKRPETTTARWLRTMPSWLRPPLRTLLPLQVNHRLQRLRLRHQLCCSRLNSNKRL